MYEGPLYSDQSIFFEKNLNDLSGEPVYYCEIAKYLFRTNKWKFRGL